MSLEERSIALQVLGLTEWEAFEFLTDPDTEKENDNE